HGPPRRILSFFLCHPQRPIRANLLLQMLPQFLIQFPLNLTPPKHRPYPQWQRIYPLVPAHALLRMPRRSCLAANASAGQPEQLAIDATNLSIRTAAPPSDRRASLAGPANTPPTAPLPTALPRQPPP